MLMTSQPLTDTDLDCLTEIFARFGAQGAMNLERLDGFFAALICGPDLVHPSEYLPVVWGDQMINEEGFSSKLMLGEFISLITRHWNAISDTLRTGNVFLP